MNTVRCLAETLTASHADEAARVLEKHPAGDVAAFLQQQAPEAAASVVGACIPIIAADYLTEISPDHAVRIVQALDGRHALSILRHLRTDPMDAILQGLPASTRTALQHAVQCESNTAGALMNPLAFVLPETMTIAEAMRRVRAVTDGSFYFPHVVDREQRLTGVLTVGDVMAARPRQTLAEVMRRDVVRIRARATGRDLVQLHGWRDYQALPVVDDHGTLVGVLNQQAMRELEGRAQTSRESGSLSDGLLTICQLYLRSATALMPLLSQTLASFVSHREKGNTSHA